MKKFKALKIIQFIIQYKFYIIIIISLLGVGWGVRWYEQSKIITQYNELIDEVKAQAKEEQDKTIIKKDSVADLKQKQINTLIQRNEQASKTSKYWRREAQRAINNPDYDIDFITAANILAKSKYRPTEPNDTIRQRSDY